MPRTWRLVGTFVILTAWTLIAPAVSASGPAAAPSSPEAPATPSVAWLAWVEDWAARLGLVGPPDLPVPGDRPAEPVGRAPLGLEAGDDSLDLTTQDDSTCEPGTTDRSCSIDPNG